MPDDNRLIEAWRKLALIEYPNAATFAELVTGGTEDEIRESARMVHERVQSIGGSGDGFDQVRQQAQDFYGRGPTTGSAGNAPIGYTPPDAAAIRRENAFAEKFNNAPRDIYGQRLGISPHEVNAYTSSRFVGQVLAKVREFALMTRSDQAARRR